MKIGKQMWSAEIVNGQPVVTIVWDVEDDEQARLCYLFKGDKSTWMEGLVAVNETVNEFRRAYIEQDEEFDASRFDVPETEKRPTIH